MTDPLVACIVPTLNRPETHESLYATFAAQDYGSKVLIVLDESSTASPFFRYCQDPRVLYVHAPSAKGEVTRIGAVRNKLCELARKAGAALIAHLDDDDHYSRSYLSTMKAKLGSGQLVKLAIFRLLVDGGPAAGTLWQWDVRKMDGLHYGLRGDAEPQGPIEIEADDDPRYAEAMRLGYGFSFMFRADLQAEFPFPEEGTEDYPWVRTLREHGVDVIEVDDFADGCVHVVHEGSQSMVWPQTYIGKQGLSGAPMSLREFARWRMLGALPQMYELPLGKDFFAEPGVTYNIVAKIDNSHTLKSITTRAESWGLTISAARDKVDASEFGVKPAPKGHRLVQIMGSASKRTKIPWKGNKLIRAFDKSEIERAWASQPPVGAAVNTQLAPAAGTGKLPAEPLHGFGGGRCPTCVNYAWSPEMGGSVKAVDGTMHHPSCNKLVGLADTKMERRIQRMYNRRPDLLTTLGPRGRDFQINAQLSPR